MAAEIPTSAIIAIESSRGWEFESRPDIPGIAYPGMVSLWGGTGRPGEHPLDTLVRELREEITVDPDQIDIEPLWEPTVRKAPLNGGPLTDIKVHTFVGRVGDRRVGAREAGHAAISFARGVFLNGPMPANMTDFAYGITKCVILGVTPNGTRSN